MKTIKLKVKHIIITIASLVVIIAFYQHFIHPGIQLSVAEKELWNGDERGVERVFSVLEKDTIGVDRFDVIERFLLESRYSDAHSYAFYYGYNMSYSTGSGFMVEIPISDKLPYLKEYVEEGPIRKTYYMRDAIEQLVEYYVAKGDVDEAEQIIIQLEERIRERREFGLETIALVRVHMYKDEHKYSLAEQLLEEIEQYEIERIEKLNRENAGGSFFKYFRSEQLTLAKYHLYMKQERYREALAVLEEGIIASEKEEAHWRQVEREMSNDSSIDVVYDGIEEVHDASASLQTYIRQLEKVVELLEQNPDAQLPVVRGEIVRRDGSPVSNAGVFLRDASNAHSTIVAYDPYQTQTNADGSFAFYGVLPGSYTFTLGFDLTHLDGLVLLRENNKWIDVQLNEESFVQFSLQTVFDVKAPVNEQTIENDIVRFEWEEVEGASYYNLNVGFQLGGGIFSTSVREGIKTNEWEMSVDEVYALRTFGYSYNEDGKIIPETLLGIRHPDTKITWSVDAFDGEGNMIGSSNGYRISEKYTQNEATFYLKKRQLTKADRLLLNGQIEEALELYKQNFAANQNDIHALQMVNRIHQVNTKLVDYNEEDVLYYLIALAERELTSNDINSVMHYFKEKEQWDDYNDWYERYQQFIVEHDQPLKTHVETEHAVALMKQGKYEEALTHFQKVMPLENDNNNVKDWIALELYFGASVEDAKIIATQYWDWSFQQFNWVHLLTNMIDEQSAMPHSIPYLEEGIQLYVEGEHEALEEFLSKETSYDAHQKFLKGLIDRR